MTTDALVTDVSWDWAIACDVHQQFMQNLDPAIDTVDSSARCRQVHEVGGDCRDFVPLADKLMALTIGDASGTMELYLSPAPIMSSANEKSLSRGMDKSDLSAAVIYPKIGCEPAREIRRVLVLRYPYQ